MAADEPVGRGMATDELIEMVLGLVPDAAVVVDAEGLIVAVNERVGQLFGYAGDELLGAPLETLVPERFRSRHRVQRQAYQGEPHVRPMGVGLDLRVEQSTYCERKPTCTAGFIP